MEFVNEFKRFPSLQAIKEDCQHIVSRIREDLYKDFDDYEVRLSFLLLFIVLLSFSRTWVKTRIYTTLTISLQVMISCMICRSHLKI